MGTIRGPRRERHELHTLLDYDGNMPSYVNTTDGKTADNKGAYDLSLIKGSVIVADRIYNDLFLLTFGTARAFISSSGTRKTFNTPSLKKTNEAKTVLLQIWTALITILILKALKAMAKFGWHLSNLVAFIRLDLFVKIDLQQWLDKPFEEPKKPPENALQGVSFENQIYRAFYPIIQPS